MNMAYKYHDQLSSERFITRFLTRGDIAAWSHFFEDADSIAYLPISELTPLQRSEEWMERQFKRYAQEKYGHQALILKDTGEFIGQCGLIKQEVDGAEVIEVGYHILKQYRGHGYAPEAARLFIHYAFEHGITDTVVSIIAVENIRSQRVAEKNGLRRERQTIWNGMDVYIYRIQQQDRATDSH